MDVTRKGDVVMCGYFEDSIKMNPDGIHNQLKSTGGTDMFITKFGICALDSLTSAITACQAYTLQGQVYTLSGSYTQVVPGAPNCDTAFSFNLTVNHPNTGISKSGITLNAAASGALYQWINCNANIPIPGAHAQTFTPSSNGSYAVIVTENGCSDTSQCLSVTGVGLKELNKIQRYTIYPNPVTEDLIIHAATSFEEADIRVFNMTGNLRIQQTSHQQQESILKVSALATGIYLLVIDENGIRQRLTFVKN